MGLHTLSTILIEFNLTFVTPMKFNKQQHD